MLAVRLAEALSLPAEQTRLIRLAAPLHDVGKIGIPDAILLKPGRLTDEEFDHMKRHTTIGAQMLSGGASAQIALAEQITSTHHERFDGTAYPAGLAGDAIPIAGRIVAVADVFDALTHARPYKKAWPRADALEELRRQRGRQFDPGAIDAFLALEREPEHPTDLHAQPSQLSPTGRRTQADAVLRAIASQPTQTGGRYPCFGHSRRPVLLRTEAVTKWPRRFSCLNAGGRPLGTLSHTPWRRRRCIRTTCGGHAAGADPSASAAA